MPTSARIASLLANRRRYTSEKRKVLARPGSLSSTGASLAKKTLNAEIDSYVDRYNDGLVSNEDFLSYMSGIQSNTLLSPTEKIDIENKVRDFTKKIQVEQLESRFKNAQGYDRVSVANQLGSYYEKEAGNMPTATPAQSQAQQLAADWRNKAVTEEDSILKDSRKTMRLKKFYEIAAMNPDSIDTYVAKINAYNQLAQQAQSDGDANEAFQYATQARQIQAELPSIQEKLDKQNASASRSDRLNRFRTIQNDYHDGRITLEAAAQAAAVIDAEALEAEDTSLISAVNSFGERLQKDYEKGVTRGDIEGLPFIKRGTTGSGASIKQMRQVFDLEDDNYRDALRVIKQIPDAIQRTAALVNLQHQYLKGSAPNEQYPDGWEGVENRAEFWKQLAVEYPNKDYADRARDATDKANRLYDDLVISAGTLEKISPASMSDEMAQSILGEPLSPDQKMTFIQPGSRDQGIMVSYDSNGNPYEKTIFLDSEYQDSDTGEFISTKLGRDVAKVTDENGVTKYIKLTPVFITDPEGDPDFRYGLYNGELMIADPYTGEVTRASEKVSQLVKEGMANQKAGQIDPLVQWYEQNKHLEKPAVSPTGEIQAAQPPAQSKVLSPVSFTPEELKQQADIKARTIPGVNGKPATVQTELPGEVTLKPDDSARIIRAAEPVTPHEISMRQVQDRNREVEKLTVPQPAGENRFTTAGIPKIDLGQAPKPIELKVPPVPQPQPSLMQQLQPITQNITQAAGNLYQKGKDTVKSLINKFKWW